MSKMLKVVGASWVQTKISSYILGTLSILAVLVMFMAHMERIQEDGNFAATVFYSEKTGYRIDYWGQSNDLADIPRGVARAYFRAEVDTTGWSILEVETDGSYPDEVQAYAAGIVEGALTWSLINSHLENTITSRCEDATHQKQCGKLRDYLDKSVARWKDHAEDRANVDPFWHHVNVHYHQIDGLFRGWQYGVERVMGEPAAEELDVSDLYWLNSFAEAFEIQQKLNMTIDDSVIKSLPGASSAFVRFVNESDNSGEGKKLFVAQNAAGSYSSMTRILKRYKLNYHITSDLHSAPAPGLSIDFSGYPGSIISQDEFYHIQGENHKLAVTGTAIRNFNNKLWKDVNITACVPLGPRITAANHLATNVSSWVHILATNNSGTGSKQWMVVDFNKFDSMNEDVNKRKKKNEFYNETIVNNGIRHTIVHHSSDGTLRGLVWLVEQIPGRTHSKDLSHHIISQGYWATFGIPHFKDISDIIYPKEILDTYKEILNSTESPKAATFKNGYKNATSLEKILKLMRQINMAALNRANNDTYKCKDKSMNCLLKFGQNFTSILGIRGDVMGKYKENYGVIDTKVIYGTQNQEELELSAVSSPPFTQSYSAEDQSSNVNKGNVVSFYTNQFDDSPSINSLEIRDLLEELEEEYLEKLNKDVIKPFQWSEDKSNSKAPRGLPDKWDFDPFKPNFTW